MEGDQEKEVKAYKNDISNISNHQDKDDKESKTLYNCAYCKRGFTTAQALGGHMNIHRKDRAKMQISTTSSGETKRPHELSLFQDKASSGKSTSSQDRHMNDEGNDELDLTLRLGHDL